ncbi:MAG: major capsid protein [Nitrospinales bacterium]
MLNPFVKSNLGFSDAELMAAIIEMPIVYGRTNQLNIFPVQPTSRTSILVEKRKEILNVLEFQPRGAPGTVAEKENRDIRSFVIPHVPHDDSISPEDVQDIRAFASDNQMETTNSLLIRKLMAIRNKHSITLERMRMGALKGQIKRADGSVLIDLYKEFSINQKNIDFVLGTAGTDVKTKCFEVKRHMEDKLLGEVMDGVHCLCSATFFDAFTSHAEVKSAYSRFQDGIALIEDNRRAFRFGGITFEEYRGKAPLPNGTVEDFIPEGDCRFYPTGTLSTFWTYFGPGDFMDTVNTPGQEIYIRQKDKDFNRGVHNQTRLLFVCARHFW